MEPGITVHLDEVGGLAAQLSSLAAELDDDARICRSTAGLLREALGGDAGWRAGALALAWGALAEVVAARAGEVAAMLVSATVSYRETEATLARGMAPSPWRPQ